MSNQLVEYRSKQNTAGKWVEWTVLDYDVPFKSLRMRSFDIRINGEFFDNKDDPTFKDKYNNAMIWVRLTGKQDPND